MMFSIDFDEKIVMKIIRGAVRDNPPDETAKIPDGAVALTQSVDLKFLAGINHNTPFIILHHINITYIMLIACKELHWLSLTWQMLGQQIPLIIIGSSLSLSPAGQ